MIDPRTVQEFLDLRRIAVVGASADERKFGTVVYKKLRDSGYDVFPVNPGGDVVAGDPCFASVAAIPDGVEGAIIMTSPDHAADAVRSCLDAGVNRIWLFRGIGGPGATTEEAVRLCDTRGATTIVGACPFMFLEPVGGIHRLHRTVRRLKGAVAA